MTNILIIASDGFEQSELEVPRDKLREIGATVHVATPDGEDIKGWDETDWGDTATSDLSLDAVKVEDYDALVLPGGQINPDVLRLNETAVSLIKRFADAKKPVAAICHAPWLLIEAGLVDGVRLTSYSSIRTDLKNAGADVVDEEVVVTDNIITSRNPDDLNAFVGAIADMVGLKHSKAA